MRKILSIILITVLAFILVGCSGISYNKDYYKYSYDSFTNTFVKSGDSLSFSNGLKAYRYNYNFGVSIMGDVEDSYSGYSLKLNSDISAALLGLDKALDEDSLSFEEYQELRKQLEEQLSSAQKLFLYKTYLFDTDSISLIKSIDDWDEKSLLSSPEGVYEFTNDTKTMYKLESGFVYVITIDDKGKKTEKEGAVAKYLVQDSFLTITRINSDGSDLLIEGKKQSLSYLFAQITYPEDFGDFDLSEDNEYFNTIRESAKKLAGKKLAVLTNSFYSTE